MSLICTLKTEARAQYRKGPNAIPSVSAITITFRRFGPPLRKQTDFRKDRMMGGVSIQAMYLAAAPQSFSADIAASRNFCPIGETGCGDAIRFDRSRFTRVSIFCAFSRRVRPRYADRPITANGTVLKSGYMRIDFRPSTQMQAVWERSVCGMASSHRASFPK